MNTTVLYPGTFSPPTLGHFDVVQRAAKIFPKIIILCSLNPDKDPMFNARECKLMWQRCYKLPDNVSVLTFEEIQKAFDKDSIPVLIRGVRDGDDLKHEGEVMKLNKRLFNVTHYFYAMADENLAKISSSKVREMVQESNVMDLHKYVSPLVITAMWEKKFNLKNLIMVVGKPASGKSTFLNMVTVVDPSIVHINTDKYNRFFRRELEAFFGTNLLDVILNHEQELHDFIGEKWLNKLFEDIAGVPPGSNVFLEIPYGMKSGKDFWKYVGGKVLYVGCDNDDVIRERLRDRMTEFLEPLVDSIPDLKETDKIVQEHGMVLNTISTSKSLGELQSLAENFVKFLHENETVFFEHTYWKKYVDDILNGR